MSILNDSGGVAARQMELHPQFVEHVATMRDDLIRPGGRSTGPGKKMILEWFEIK
jgi:hypothetical protein